MMEFPTLGELVRQPANFVKYQDGKLWYRVLWVTFADDGTPQEHPFDFPIPVDLPELYEVVEDAIQALRMEGASYDSDDRELLGCTRIAKALDEVLTSSRSLGASGGEFLTRDKAIIYMRWIRRHLEFLKQGEFEE